MIGHCTTIEAGGPLERQRSVMLDEVTTYAG
jgi:hypothetical protein